MKLHVDKEADALYLRFGETKIIESEEVSPGIILDFNDKDEVVAIEVLHLNRGSRSVDLTTVSVETSR